MRKTDGTLVGLLVLLLLLTIPMLILFAFVKGVRIDTGDFNIPGAAEMVPTEIALTRAVPRGVSGADQWASDMERWAQEHGVPVAVQRQVMLWESGGQQYKSTPTGLADGPYAKGLFQVVNYRSRPSDLFDPDVNARVGLGYLRGCNSTVNGGVNNWQTHESLYNTILCYHDGEGNWKAGYRSKSGSHYAKSVANAITGGGQAPAQNTQQTAQAGDTADAPIGDDVPIDNMCQLEPHRNCQTDQEWIEGWCEYKVLYTDGGHRLRAEKRELPFVECMDATLTAHGMKSADKRYER